MNSSHDLRRAPAGRTRASRTRAVVALGALVALPAAVLALAGCGSSGATLTAPSVAPARTFALAGFQPSAPVVAGRPTTLSFAISQPAGGVLTSYRTCCDPHAGVDLIIVRSDDSHVQYDDSSITAGGTVSQPVTFPTPGRYRVIVDAYPKQTAPNAPINFQLFTWVTVRGAYHPQPLPPATRTEVVDGYRFQIQGHPRLRAIQADFVSIKVLGPTGRNAVFGTWHGALAHAIFIRDRSLAYIHTHVCSPGAIYCTSILGAARVTGTSSAPGELKVGVLLPEAGTWRLFLLTYIGGRHQVAPFVLQAGP